MPNSKLRDALYGARVRSGPLVLVALFLAARPTGRSLLLGGAIAVIGLVVRAWAAGHIQKEKCLAITGPYRFSRNPLYVGNFILGIGVAAASHSWWGAALFALYFVLFYPPVILEERDRMRRLFPEQYAHYEKHVPLFLPRLSPGPRSGEERFRWALYAKNKEFRAVLGAALVWLVLVAKSLLRPGWPF